MMKAISLKEFNGSYKLPDGRVLIGGLRCSIVRMTDKAVVLRHTAVCQRHKVEYGYYCPKCVRESVSIARSEKCDLTFRDDDSFMVVCSNCRKEVRSSDAVSYSGVWLCSCCDFGLIRNM